MNDQNDDTAELQAEEFNRFGTQYLDQIYAKYSSQTDILSGTELELASLPIHATASSNNEDEVEEEEEEEEEQEQQNDEEDENDEEEEEEEDGDGDNDAGGAMEEQEMEERGAKLPEYLRAVVQGLLHGVELSGDDNVFTLEGPQGCGKSTFCRRLARDLAAAQLQFIQEMLNMGNGVSADEAKKGLTYGGVPPPRTQSSKLDEKEDEKKEERYMKKYLKARTETFENQRRLVETREGRPDLFLPLVIPIDDLDEMMSRVKPPLNTLLPAYIKDRYGADSSTCKILLELCVSRRLVILMDGIDEASKNGTEIVRYFLSTLVEDRYPLVILTATSGVMPADIRDEGIKSLFLSPLSTEEQHKVLQLLCDGNTTDGRYDQAKDLLFKSPFDAMSGNPLLLSQFMNLLRCGPDAMRDIRKNGLMSSLQQISLRQLLDPKHGVNDEGYLETMKDFGSKNGITIPFASFEEEVRSELAFLKTDTNIELVFRVSYDTHQRMARHFGLEDIQAVATEAQSRGGLPEIISKLAWIDRLPIFEARMMNDLTPSLKMPHLSLQLHAAAKFTEMEFRATIEAFNAKQKAAGGGKKAQVEEDKELEELVRLIFTLEGREPFSALRNVWWQPVFDVFMKTIPKDVSQPVLSVVAKHSPVEATAALTRAVEAGDRMRARLLLAAHTEVDSSFTRPDPREGTLPLHHLCGAQFPQLSLVRVMLDVYRDGIRVRDREGMLPLHWACNSASPHEDLLVLLLEYYKGAAGEHDEAGRVPFHCLAQNAVVSPNVVHAVLKAWPALNLQDNNGLMPLHLACKAKKPKSHFVMALLEDPRCAEAVKHPDPATGLLPLHLLCASPCVTLPMLKLIVDIYPEACNHTDKESRRPLDMLLTQDTPSAKMVQVLLNQYIAPEDGKAKLELDPKTMLSVIFRFLFTHPKPTKEITLALCSPLMEVQGLENMMRIVGERVMVLRLPTTPVKSDLTVELLQSVPPVLMKGGGAADEEEAGGIGKWVCNTNAPSEHTVKTMLQVDKNGVKRPDKDGMLPLHWACKATEPNEGAIKALLDAHAPAAQVMTKVGKLPLHFLVENRKCTESMLKLLLRVYKGGALDYDKSTGLLPLHAAILSPRAQKKAWLKSINLLIKAYPGAVEETDQHSGMLPLHMACKRPAPSVALVSQLLEMYPIAVTLPDSKKGCLPLHWMMRSSSKKKRVNEKVVKMLLKHHPDAARDFDDGAGRLPLHYICVLEGSSAELCKVMCEAFAEAVEMGDELAGRLPLHWACKNPNGRLSRELVKSLVVKFPQALRQPDTIGMLPIHYACSVPSPSVDTVKAMLAGERNSKLKNGEQSIALIPDKHHGYRNDSMPHHI
jgi:ankyrin repeat protein